MQPRPAPAIRPRPAEPPPGALVNLAETIVIKEENVFVVTARDGSLPLGAAHPLGVYRDDCRFLSATSCTSTASGRGCSSPRPRPARSRCTS